LKKDKEKIIDILVIEGNGPDAKSDAYAHGMGAGPNKIVSAAAVTA